MNGMFKSLYRMFLDNSWVAVKHQHNERDFYLSFYNKIDDEMTGLEVSFICGEWRHD